MRDDDRARYDIERTRHLTSDQPTEGAGRAGWIEQDRFGCWSAVRACDGERLMCGLSAPCHAMDVLRLRGYQLVRSDSETLALFEAQGCGSIPAE